MTRELPRSEYTDLFGATEGDRLRLGDTELLAEIERDHTTYGDEAVFGGGKTMRDGMGMQSGVTQAEGALDWVFSNAVVIDPILGIQKGDIGVRNGRIAGIGKAGNPDTMDGVDDDLVIGASTDAVPADGLIARQAGSTSTFTSTARGCSNTLSRAASRRCSAAATAAARRPVRPAPRTSSASCRPPRNGR